MAGPSSPLLSTRRRHKGPMFSPEQFRSAQSQSGSNATSCTSFSFLTPFLLGPRSMSPPPKQEADDYLNVHGHYNDRTKHHKRKGKKRHNLTEGSDEPRPTPYPSATRPRALSSAGSGCEHCSNEDHGADVDSTCDSPLVMAREHLVVRTDTKALAGAVDADPAQSRTWPRLNTWNGKDDGSESPAVNALRSLSQPQPIKSDQESQRLRPMSSALANSFKFLTSRTPTTSSGVSSQSMSPQLNLAPGRKRSHRKSLAFRDGDRRRPTFREGKHASGKLTPSSITLRKASNVNVPALPGSSMSASLSHEDENLRSTEAPASELLAFYASKSNQTSTSTSLTFQTPNTPCSPLKLTQEASSDVERRPSKTACPPTVHFSKVRRQSVLAATTLTYTDVHIAPGTFATGSKSRRQSLAVTEPPARRISVVQFRSRNSIHETIWREDETTSGSSLTSSSRTSTSPHRLGQPLRFVEPSPDDQDDRANRAQTSSAPSAPLSSNTNEHPPPGLFQWSWGRPSAPSNITVQTSERTDTCLDPARLTSAANPGPPRPRRSSDPYANLESHKRCVSEVGADMQSFPPLRDRSSTLEWQRAPLVDINAPVAGRGTGVGSREVNRGFELAKAEEGEGREGRRPSAHPCAPARNGSTGRVGSSVGSSSHVRVRQGGRRVS